MSVIRGRVDFRLHAASPCSPQRASAFWYLRSIAPVQRGLQGINQLIATFWSWWRRQLSSAPKPTHAGFAGGCRFRDEPTGAEEHIPPCRTE